MKSGLVSLVLFFVVLDDGLLMARLTSFSPCPTVSITNGKIRRRQRGRFVKFVCNAGYLLAGERYSTCSQGDWDPPPPKCVKPTCMNKVHPPLNGSIYPTHSGAALHFFCRSGFELRGPTDIYCDGRKWDNNAPICLPINTKPKLYCDFETEDICGWSHDLNHDFDWRRQNYQTPSGSIGTGPSFDHTKGKGADGHYMYIESSSKNENDTARLISPLFETSSSETCLEFFYHMYGLTTGSLRVYMKKISENWTLVPANAIFSKSGNQGDRWYRSYHSLGIIDEEYQIVVEGVRGPGYISDIAVDDIKIIENCKYKEDISSTTTEEPFSTETLMTVESCENRCGHKASANETHEITCDCDENCEFNSTCCPDYLDFCFAAYTTDSLYSTTEVPKKTSAKATTLPSQTSTLLPNRTTTKASTAQSKPTSTTVRTTVTEKKKPKPTTRATTVTYKPTKKKTLPPVFPTIRILTPSTTVEIVRKVFPFTKSTGNNIPNINYVTRKSVTLDKEADTSDVMDLPKQQNNDEELLLTSPFPDADNNVSKEPWLVEPDRSVDSIYMRNFSETNKLLSQKMPEIVNYNVVLIVISVVGVTVLIMVIAIFIIRRYKCYRHRMSYANGDSQSDVRYLTSDEILDFSLDKGYDDL